MRLSDFLNSNDISYTAFAQAIGTSKVCVRRYALDLAIPRPDIMKKIYVATSGAVAPNDFYELPSSQTRGGDLPCSQGGSLSQRPFGGAKLVSAPTEGGEMVFCSTKQTDLFAGVSS